MTSGARRSAGPAAALCLRHVTRHDGELAGTVPGLSMFVNEGEFAVVSGPAGCGLSTLVRVVAGLEPVGRGQVLIDGNDVSALEPAARDIAMVFQNHGLYPHMTVFQNMSYGLRLRRLDKDRIRARVGWAADILDIGGLLERRPYQLSCEQRLRVALGRAIVNKPRVILFDEPLAQFDAASRIQMRYEIQRLHQRMAITCLYATHDPVEAMTLAQRMIVLNHGQIEQAGPPCQIYDQPVSTFVAGFVGSPPMNLLPCHVDADRRVIDDSGVELQFEPALVPDAAMNRRVFAGMRPEQMRLHAPGLPIQVELVEVLGHEQLIHGMRGDHPVAVRCPVALTRNYPIEAGETIQIGIDGTDHMHWFDRDTGLRIGTGHQDDSKKLRAPRA